MMRKEMIDSTTTITKNCLMDYDQAALVLSMLEMRDEFSDIGVDIEYDFETLGLLHNSEGKVLVKFEIPRTIDMPVFFGEFYNALNSKDTVSRSTERR